MTTVPTNASAEVTAVDTTARCSLLPLLAGSLVWLVVSGVLALINAIQLIKPGFLADCAIFTFGRTHAMQETAFAYGWAAGAGLALSLWILGRLGGDLLRARNWTLVGTVFWNLGVLLALVGIATGEGSGIPLLGFPGYVQLLLLFSYGAIALAGILAWSGRRHETTYAAQWYAAAALFLFPWLLTGAQAALVASPFRGVAQAVAAGWFAQGAFTLWLAPLALAGAYYVVPKITGRALPAYDFATLGFWALVFIGAWTGGRHLVGGPVPAWVASVAIVACSLLLVHYIVVFLNLRGAFGGGGTALKCIACGLAAYVFGGVLDAVTAMRDVALLTQFTYFAQAQQQLALCGAISMMLYGTLYFALPRLTGRPWISAALVKAHVAAAGLGLVLLVLGLAMAGWTQGHDLLNATVSFAEVAAHTRTGLLIAISGQFVLLVGSILLAVNFFASICPSRAASESASSLFHQPATMEASVS